MSIQVIRVLEYVYPDQAAVDMDMATWQVPPVGAKTFDGGCSVRSTIFFPKTVDRELFTVEPGEVEAGETLIILAPSVRDAVTWQREKNTQEAFTSIVLPGQTVNEAVLAHATRAVQLAATTGEWGAARAQIHLAGIELVEETDFN